MASTPGCRRDRRGTVGVDDLLVMAAAWGPCGDEPCPADVTDDNVVDTSDLLYLLVSWGPCEDD